MKKGFKKMARQASTVQVGDHTARVININKKISTPTGTEITRKAVINVREFASFDDMNEVYDSDAIAKFAQIGMIYRARVIGNNQLTSGTLDDATKALLKVFRQSMDTLVNVMEMSKDEALKNLLSKPKFSSLEATIKALESAGDLNIDYVGAQVPLPAEGEDEADDEVESPE